MKLIVQGAFLSTSETASFAQMAKAFSAEQTGAKVWKFHDVEDADREGIAALAEILQADIAFLPDSAQLSDYKLIAMDMDGTFIQIECIDEMADLYGVKDQVAAITHASMKGELDFDESLNRRVALLAGLDETALQKVYDERLRLSPGAEAMLETLQNAGIRTLLVSGGFTFFTEKLKARHKLDYTRSNLLEIKDGKLTGKIIGGIVNADEKAKTLAHCCEKWGIAPKETIAIGDGANDLKMLHGAGLSIAYHAKPTVRQQAQIALDYAGLDGVVNLFR